MKPLLLLVIAACCMFGCKEQIVHNLGESEVNRLITRLQEVTIDGAKVKQPDGRWALSVEQEQAVKALSFLEQSRALRETVPNAEKPSIISSREDQRFHFERALSHEIETTLLAMRNVLEARVHLNLAAVDPLLGQPLSGSVSSASVLLVTTAESACSSDQVAALVSGASGVKKENISVVLVPEKEISRGQMGASGQSLRVQPEMTAETRHAELAGVFSQRDLIVGAASLLVILGVLLSFLGLRRTSTPPIPLS